MTTSSTRGNYFLLMIGVVGSTAVAPCPASDSNQSVATIETRTQALQFEFSQAGEALRERLDREATGDWLGAARAAQSAGVHRARFLVLKRQFAESSPSQSSASVARDNPFLPDTRFAATRAGAAIATAGRLNVSDDEHRVRTVATPLAAWDMYRSAASASARSIAGNAADSVPTTSVATLERTWGMYSRATRRPEMNEVRASTRRPPDAEDHRETPKQPFLAYRDPMAGAR